VLFRRKSVLPVPCPGTSQPRNLILYYLRCPGLAVPHTAYYIIVEFRLMAYKEHAPAIFLKSALKLLFGVHIQVVGGLVKDQYISLLVYQLAKSYFSLFSSAQYHDLALNMLCGKAALCQG